MSTSRFQAWWPWLALTLAVVIITVGGALPSHVIRGLWRDPAATPLSLPARV